MIEDRTFKEALRLAGRQLADRTAIGAPQRLDRACTRQKGPHDAARRGVVRTEHGERIAVPGLCQRLDFRPSKDSRLSAHASARAWAGRIRLASRYSPCKGIEIQIGRLPASYISS